MSCRDLGVNLSYSFLVIPHYVCLAYGRAITYIYNLMMIMAMKINPTVKIVAIVALLFSAHLNSSMAQQNESLLNFKFNHLSNIQSAVPLSQVLPSANNSEVAFAQYDATWTYPWETQNMNIDLGVTLRHLSGFNNSSGNLGNRYFQEVLPLIHASALFALPLNGLSAGIEGSHLDSNNQQVFDYRAKVSYEWRKGFGLQGGWQHQQFNLDNASSAGTGFTQTGPFIDLYLSF